MRPRRGHTLLEILVAASLFGLLMLILGVCLTQSQDVWRTANGTSDTSLQLRRGLVGLREELSKTSLTQLQTRTVPASLGGGGLDGDALWFLSANDPATGAMVRDDAGNPVWQRNILYYCVAPANHGASFGLNCAGGVGPGGYDDRCPHKVLLRKVIDTSGVPDPKTDQGQEPLLTSAQVAAYLTRPSGYDTTSMNSEANLNRVQIAARQLLWFHVTVANGRVTLELKAVAEASARRRLTVGSASLYDSPFTNGVDAVVEPENP